MSKGVTIVVGVFVGGGLGVLGGVILPCSMYPDSNLCGIFGAITMPAGAVVGGVTGAMLSARRASFAVMCGALLGGTVGVVGIIIPAMMYPKSDVSSLLFLLFPVTTMLGGAALGAVLGELVAPPRRKPGIDEDPSVTDHDGPSHS